ncbi:unnamed protein product [Hymenolepis diminuta]|uniref:Uncharacterized protein n=1 Tax=Hymenolepis diminuta TaxID=6216 RepID=A0A564YYA7_HYMDI|nr:unnamed protein product [Hymenolepis diminuta]
MENGSKGDLSGRILTPSAEGSRNSGDPTQSSGRYLLPTHQKTPKLFKVNPTFEGLDSLSEI